MRLSMAAVTLALSVPCLVTAQSVEQQLKKLEVAWGDAGIKKDFATLDKIVADDYSSIDEDGAIQTKAQGDAALKSGEDVMISQVLSDMKVRVYGDTAVITGKAVTKGTHKGKDIGGTFMFTDVWVKHGALWQCVAEHVSKLAKA
jgi:ketosteroid isomerase-like protein